MTDSFVTDHNGWSSFHIFEPPSLSRGAIFLTVSPETAAWLRSVALTTRASTEMVQICVITYMLFAAPRCFPWSTSFTSSHSSLYRRLPECVFPAGGNPLMSG